MYNIGILNYREHAFSNVRTYVHNFIQILYTICNECTADMQILNFCKYCSITDSDIPILLTS